MRQWVGHRERGAAPVAQQESPWPTALARHTFRICQCQQHAIGPQRAVTSRAPHPLPPRRRRGAHPLERSAIDRRPKCAGPLTATPIEQVESQRQVRRWRAHRAAQRILLVEQRHQRRCARQRCRPTLAGAQQQVRQSRMRAECRPSPGRAAVKPPAPSRAPSSVSNSRPCANAAAGGASSQRNAVGSAKPAEARSSASGARSLSRISARVCGTSPASSPALQQRTQMPGINRPARPRR